MLSRQALSPLSPNRARHQRQADAPGADPAKGAAAPVMKSPRHLSVATANNNTHKKTPVKSPKPSAHRTGASPYRKYSPRMKAKSYATPVAVLADEPVPAATKTTATITAVEATVIADKENAGPNTSHALTPSRLLTKAVGVPATLTPIPAPASIRTLTPDAATPIMGTSSITPMSRTPQRTATATANTTELGANCYSFTFAAGPMGLELEPVLTSSTGQMGCRVRDFYFGLEYPSAHRAALTAAVRVGDVLSAVDGESVLSSSFDQVLALLRSKANVQREVCFKNMSLNTNAATSTTASTASTKKGLIAESPAKLLRGLLAASDSPTGTGWKVYPGTPAAASATSTTAAASSPAQRGASNADNIALTVSPRAVKALRYELAADDLAAVYYHSTHSPAPPRAIQRSPIPASSPTPNSNRTSTSSPAAQPDLNRVLADFGSSLLGGLGLVGNKILGGGSGSSSSSSSNSASSPQSEQQQIEALVGLKHQLITELATTCVQLGAAEDKHADATVQLDAARSEQVLLKQQIFLLEERSTSQQEARQAAEEQALAHQHAAQAATSSLQAEQMQKQAQEEAFEAQQQAAAEASEAALKEAHGATEAERELHLHFESKYTQLQALHAQLQLCQVKDSDNHKQQVEEAVAQASASSAHLLQAQEQVQQLQQQLDTLQHEAAQERAAWALETDTMAADSTVLRSDMEQAFQSAASSLKQVEQERDALLAELEVLRDVGSSELSVKATELSRTKDALATLREAHATDLQQCKEDASAAAAVSIAALQAQHADELEKVRAAGTLQMARVVELEALATQHESELSSSRKSVSALHCEASTAQTSLANTQEQLRIAEQTAAAIREQQEHDRAAIQQYRDTIQRGEDALVEQKLTDQACALAQSNQLQQMKDALLESSDLALAAQAQLETTQAEHASAVAALTASLSVADGTVQQLQHSVDTLRDDNGLLSAKVAQTEATILEQLQSLEHLTASKAQSQAATERVTEEMQQQQAEFLHSSGEAEAQLADANAHLYAAMEEVAGLESKLAALQLQSDALLQAKDGDLSTASERSLTVQESNLLLEDQLDQAVFAYQNLRVEYDDLASTSATSAAASVAQQEQEQQQHFLALAAVEAELVQAQAQIQTLQAAVAAAADEKTAILLVSDGQQEEASALTSELQDRLLQLSESFQTVAESELVSVRSELALLRTAAENTSVEYERAMTALATDLSSKFGEQLAAVQARMADQQLQFAQSEESFCEQLQAAEEARCFAAEAATVHTTQLQEQLQVALADGSEQKAQDDLRLNQTFERAQEAEKLLQLSYDDHEELRELLQATELRASQLQAEKQGDAHALQASEEKVAALQEALEAVREQCEQLQATIMQQRTEYSTVCNELQDVQKQANAAEELRDQLHTLNMQLSTTISERNEISANSKAMVASHAQVTMQVHGLLASQEEMMAEFDVERAKYTEGTARAEEHCLMLAEAQLASQLRVFETQLEESDARHGCALETAQQAFLQKLHLLDNKLHEKQAQAQARAQELHEYKRVVVPALRAEVEALAAQAATAAADVHTLQLEAVEAQESAAQAAGKHTLELCSATENFAEREAALVLQRSELTASLASQHAQLSASLAEKDSVVAELREEAEEAQTYLLGLKDARRQEQQEAQASHKELQQRNTGLTTELANMHAQINRMLHTAPVSAADGEGSRETTPLTGMSSLTSKDLVQRLEVTLKETKALLASAAAEKRALQAANTALVLTTEQQAEALHAHSAQQLSHKQYAEQQQEVQQQQQTLIVDSQMRLRELQREFDETVASHVEQAQQAMHTRHAAVLASKDATVSEVSAAMDKTRTHALQLQEELLNAEAELTALRTQCAQLTANASASTSGPLRDVTATAPPRLALVAPDAQSSLSGSSGDSSGDSSDREAHSEAPGAWHDHLVTLSLDLHEALTFAIMQQGIDDADSGVGACLKAASVCTQALHSHLVRAPWLALEEPAPQLPAAHQMLLTLGFSSSTEDDDCNDENAQPAASNICSNTSAVERPSTVVGSNSSSSGGGASALLVTQLSRRLDEATARGGLQEKELWRAHSTVDSLREQLQQQQQQQQHRTVSGPGAGAAADSSERVYLLLEELVRVFETPALNNGNGGCSADTSRSDDSCDSGSGGNRTNASLSYESDRTLWHSLRDMAVQALGNYRTRCFHRATSESSAREGGECNSGMMSISDGLGVEAGEDEGRRERGGVADAEQGDSVLSSSISSALGRLNNSLHSSQAHHVSSTSTATATHAQGQAQAQTRDQGANDLSLEQLVALAEESFEGRGEEHVVGETSTAGPAGDDSGFWNLTQDDIGGTLDSSIDSIASM